MDRESNKQCVFDFLQAYYAGDAAGAMARCAPDVETITYAPVDLFPHLGQKRGRAWVAEVIAIQQQRYAVRRHEVLFVAAEDDRVATMTRCALTKRNDDRVVQFIIAEFFTLRDGLIATHRAFFDSFDLMQQIIGRDLADDFATSIRGAMER